MFVLPLIGKFFKDLTGATKREDDRLRREKMHKDRQAELDKFYAKKQAERLAARSLKVERPQRREDDPCSTPLTWPGTATQVYYEGVNSPVTYSPPEYRYDIPAPEATPLSGSGGSFDGGGASGDWDTPKSSCDTSSDSSSYSSSSDSGSSYSSSDSGSSSCDSGSSYSSSGD